MSRHAISGRDIFLPYWSMFVESPQIVRRICQGCACNIGNFLVKESGQVSSTVMSTCERPLFRGRIADPHGKREEGRCRGLLGVASGRSENVSAGVILERRLIGCMPMSSASSLATTPNSRYFTGRGASASSSRASESESRYVLMALQTLLFLPNPLPLHGWRSEFPQIILAFPTNPFSHPPFPPVNCSLPRLALSYH